MMRRIIMFLLRTYFVRVIWRRGMHRMGMRLRDTFCIRNIFGESVGTWWDMRKIK